MKAIIWLVIIILVCIIGGWGIEIRWYDVRTATEKIKKEYKQGYLQGCSETYIYLREPYVLEEHLLGRTKPHNFAEFMWISRKEE